MSYGVWPKNKTFMPNLIKIRLSGAVLDFETCRGTYRSVETSYHRDGQSQLTVNWLFSCRVFKQRTTAKSLSVVCICDIQMEKLIIYLINWLSL
jgi:hypothetical protein